MKTRSSSKSPTRNSKSTSSPSKAKVEPKEESISPPKAKRGRAKKEEASSDEKEEKHEKKPKDSPRKKPKTEGVSDVGQAPPVAFGMPSGKEAERRHGILEHGEIFFVYRPKVQLEEVESFSDIAHFHMVLIPTTPAHSYRLITIGRKLLPQRSKSKAKRPDIVWGKVLDISDDLSTLKERLGPRKYMTKTRGERHIAAARVAGRGRYIIHSTEAKDTPKASKNMSMVYKTVLAYALQTPHELGEVQKDLHIAQEGSFQLQIKDPKSKSTNPAIRDVAPGKQPQFPKSLLPLFTTKFIPVNPPSLLNYSGAELLLLPSSSSVEEQIGPAAEGELLAEAGLQKGEEEEDEHHDDGHGHDEAKEALKELGIEDLVEGKALEGYWE